MLTLEHVEDLDRIEKLEAEVSRLEEENAAYKQALIDLWKGTVWGAGKAAVVGFNKKAFRLAGIEIGS